MKRLIILLYLLCATTVYAKHLHKEAWYQARWAAENGGFVEYLQPLSSFHNAIDSLLSEAQTLYPGRVKPAQPFRVPINGLHIHCK